MKKMICLFVFLFACSFDVNHKLPETPKLDVNIGIEDVCLTCFPECDYYRRTYSCVDVNGVNCEGCQIGCVGAREVACDRTDGPLCKNVVGSSDEPDEILVPVVCVQAPEEP